MTAGKGNVRTLPKMIAAISSPRPAIKPPWVNFPMKAEQMSPAMIIIVVYRLTFII